MALLGMENGDWKGYKKVCVRGQSCIILDRTAVFATSSPDRVE